MNRPCLRAIAISLLMSTALSGVARAETPLPQRRLIAHRLKLAGVVTTSGAALAAVVMGVGLGLMATSPHSFDSGDSAGYIQGWVLAGTGGGFALLHLAIGIPLWLVGLSQEQALQRKQPDGDAARLSISF